ncbi:MAG: cyclase family protein, partial [Vicinamibacteria bacterium]|nr:cyclase family protein [Vicinamibacteria bacterium]
MRQMAVVWVAATVLAVAPVGAQAPLDLKTARLVDLTHPFDAQTLYWPTSPSAFELTTLASGMTPGGFFYSSYKLCSPEHGGTHLDAPVHFSKTGRSTADLPLQQLMAPAVVIDATRQAAADAAYRVTRADVEAFEAAHGRIAPGTIVLVRTGWSRFWPDRKQYLGDDTPGDASKLRFPGYGEDAARFLVEQRQVAMLGIDTASIDYGPSTDFLAHRVGAAANVVNLENLTALDQLPPTGATVIALPIKIAGGSGGPVRVVALVP